MLCREQSEPTCCASRADEEDDHDEIDAILLLWSVVRAEILKTTSLRALTISQLLIQDDFQSWALIGLSMHVLTIFAD